MDFFRRIFNNPSEDPSQSNEEKPPMSSNHSNPDSSVTQSDLDTPSPESLDETEETMLDEVAEIPDTVPERDMVLYDDTDTKENQPIQDDMPLGVTQPLPPEPIPMAQSGHLVFGQSSDQGMVRTNNQDAAVSFFFTSDTVDDRPDFGVFIVADGMGGHKEGEKASALTASTVMEDIFKTIYLPMIQDEDLHSDRPTITEALTDAVHTANVKVRDKVKDGGTTITALVVLGDQAYIAHVGDSRAYLITQEAGVEQLTRDHSVVQRLIELDQLTPEEAETHEQRNVLYRAIGQNEEVEVDILRRRLPSNAQILMCSDGLWGLIKRQDIHDIVLNTVDPQEACEKLVALANMNGGTDNITAILLKFPGG
jgi:serine/threonine protein phosphatase PrpC